MILLQSPDAGLCREGVGSCYFLDILSAGSSNLGSYYSPVGSKRAARGSLHFRLQIHPLPHSIRT